MLCAFATESEVVTMTPDMVRSLPLAELDALVRGAWSAVGTGHLSEDTAQAITEAAQARRSAARVKGAVAQRKALSAFPTRRKRTVSPDRQASIHRRRSLAASGMVPARIAAGFTVGEVAVLTAVAVEAMRGGRCELAIDHLAALAGVGRTTVQNAIRLAQRQGLIAVSERRRPGRPSLPNVVTVISQEWASWISRRGRVQKAEPHVRTKIITPDNRPSGHSITLVCPCGQETASSVIEARPAVLSASSLTWPEPKQWKQPMTVSSR